ncbi:MAG TPA: serine/threonine-protein kinase, partial [Vicinamibacterales bacterium]|nr:serine/threonine-protein kinase [Vicinamibacterales bacterium]
MALTPGTRLGAYEILALLGSGGMGEVYRARDTRLDRVVAIKVLPDIVAGNPDRRQRLEREARAISRLNHPHICTLYDIGHQNGLDYLVMEFLEGQTLAERLTKGALPLNHALQCAIQLADALDVAHRHGIVHRDLKPANVFLSRSGSSGVPITKLLDFGIAKAMALSPAAASVSATLTDHGTLLGTVQYMAPEQLEGRAADVRSDLFAFGVVLYEMLTGRRAFSGESQASVIAAVLDADPSPLSTSQSLAPPALEHLVKTCLAKNPDARWQTAGDVKRQLEWIATSDWPGVQVTTVAQRARSGVHVPWTAAVVAAIVVLIAAGAMTWYAVTRPREQVAQRVTRTTIATTGSAIPSPGAGPSMAITPDGSRIVYVGNDGTQLFRRSLDQDESVAIYT